MLNSVDKNNYDTLLFNLIPHLKKLKYNRGGEGKAYFFEDFVIKEYEFSYQDNKMFKEIFSAYCEELQEFSEKGYSVPKIYSWLRIPCGNGCNYYILEERIKGRDLFAHWITDFYEFYKTKMSLSKFDKIINNPKKYLSNYREIARAYIKDFIFMNEFLEALPENVLAKFITDNFTMQKEGKYSSPDLFASNILVDTKNNKLVSIDNCIIDKLQDIQVEDKVYETEFIYNLVKLFHRNECVRNLINDEDLISDSKEERLIRKLIEKNNKINQAVIQKFIKTMNKYCDSPKVGNELVHNEIINTLAETLGEENISDIIKDIKTDF